MLLDSTMQARIIFLAICLIAPSALSAPSKRGFCLSLCDWQNNYTCPSGYECRSNGCGHQCYRTTFVQPPGCPEVTCDYVCPMGYVRDEQGCESCSCILGANAIIGS
ncbi:antistasin-like [Physella acuta]|uniref:antistasin-like n=1 Tax=Physella acuta TaxID=109671 RepID=UPI0027DEA1B0|nr:antistasin-like [Physella acuta]